MKAWSSRSGMARITAAVAIVALIAGCGSSSSSGKSSNKGTSSGGMPTYNAGFNWGDTWVKTLDPAITTDSLSIDNIELIQANLVRTDYPSLKTVPDLATYSVSSNHKVWTFHIRKNAKFSNGDSVTAQDAAWSITRSLLPSTKSPVAMTYLGEVVGAAAVNSGKTKTLKGVKVINNRTLKITLDKPIAYFLGTLSYPTAEVLDKRIVQGKTSGQLTNTCSLNVGAGPFEPVCLNKSSSKSSFYPSGHSPYINYKPNPHFYGPKPHFKIHAPFFNSADQSYKAWQGGQIEWSPVPTADIGSVKSKPGFHLVPQLETDYITPNSQSAPFNNINCRLAVAYAIDRPGVTTKLLHGTEKPLWGVVPPGLQGYIAKPNGVPSYNPTKAKQYLSKCPGRLQNVTLTYQNTSSDITHEYDAIRANIQAIGGSVTLKPLTFNSWLNIVTQSLNKTNTQITENLWIDDYPDAQDWLQNLLYTGANYNIGGFHNAQFDKLVSQGNVEFNQTKRAQDYLKASKIVLNDGAWIGVGYGVNPVIENPSLKNWYYYSNTLWPIHGNWANVKV